MGNWLSKLFGKKLNNSDALNISDDPQMNQIHKAPDLTILYANDLMVYYERLSEKNGESGVKIGEFQTLIAYYTIDLLIEYHDKANGLLPRSVIQSVKENVLSAAQMKFPVFNDKSKEDYHHFIVDRLLMIEKIRETTKKYMDNLE
jgi:hypothetical protein